jgi:hypothetical protein
MAGNQLKRPNKNLEAQIRTAVKNLRCPVHGKPAEITMESENEEVEVNACCSFFKKDIKIIGERIRKDFLYREQKTRERVERERRKGGRD